MAGMNLAGEPSRRLQSNFVNSMTQQDTEEKLLHRRITNKVTIAEVQRTL